MSDREAVALISCGALRHNLGLIRERVAPAELMAVVKDDAYGHGLDTVLELLLAEEVTRFGALDLDGALRVRERSTDAMVFAWVFDSGDDLVLAVRARIDLGVTDAATLERVAAASEKGGSEPARVHLKLDSGLHRAGVLPQNWPTLIARATELQRAGTISIAGIWTHLAEASDDDDDRSIREFRAAVEVATAAGVTRPLRHVAASAAAYFRSDARFDLVRVGAFLYGISPGGGVSPGQLGLRPVMTLRAPVLSVRSQEGRVLASIGIGGVDGILSEVSNAVTVAIGGARFRVHTVEPTRLTIDVTDGAVAVGEIVTLFGDGSRGEPTLQEWSDATGTIGEEVVTRLSRAIPRLATD